MAKTCTNCGCKITEEMIDANMCWECGYILDKTQMDEVTLYQMKVEEERQEKERQRILQEQEKERQHVSFAKSFNEFYEYDVVTIINENHGTVDKEKMMKILSDHAKNGWKLHTMYSNELGKNALSLMGFGVNATACEDVMIFERRVKELD